MANPTIESIRTHLLNVATDIYAPTGTDPYSERARELIDGFDSTQLWLELRGILSLRISPINPNMLPDEIVNRTEIGRLANRIAFSRPEAHSKKFEICAKAEKFFYISTALATDTPPIIYTHLGNPVAIHKNEGERTVLCLSDLPEYGMIRGSIGAFATRKSYFDNQDVQYSPHPVEVDAQDAINTFGTFTPLRASAFMLDREIAHDFGVVDHRKVVSIDVLIERVKSMQQKLKTVSFNNDGSLK